MLFFINSSNFLEKMNIKYIIHDHFLILMLDERLTTKIQVFSDTNELNEWIKAVQIEENIKQLYRWVVKFILTKVSIYNNGFHMRSILARNILKI